MVGCISTLRPLFQRIFKLNSSGGGSSDLEMKRTGNRAPIASQGVEENEQNGWARPKNGKSSVMIKSGQLRKNSGLSFCESEEELVQDMQKSIQVSRSVTQRRDYATGA